MLRRLRPAYSPDELHDLYPEPWSGPNGMKDHQWRIDATIALARWFEQVRTVADLSCGDAQIARALCRDPILGDLATGYPLCGPIEETIEKVTDRVDLFILSETLEHLDNPRLVLNRIRHRTRCLVMSTPDAAFDDPNPEHYWAWDQEAVKFMLVEAGFTPEVFTSLRLPATYPYTFQIWGCR